MKIEKINVDKLKAAAYNPRKDLKPGDAEFEKLKRSIEEFGYVEPVIWNKKSGNIVGGHQRLKVMKHLGYTEVDCVVVELDEQKEKALNIALNKISGAWDDALLTSLLRDLNDSGYDVSLTGFDAAETAELFGSGSMENVHEDEFDGEQAAAEIEQPVTQKGDLWLVGRHRLLCGDSTKADDATKLMDGKLADLMVTDPPYNVNYQSCVNYRDKSGHRNSTRQLSRIANDNMSDENFYAFLFDFFSAAYDALKGGASVYIFHSTKESVNFTTALKNAGFKAAQTLVWVKNHFTLGRQDYQWVHEPILYGWKEIAGCPHYFVDDRTNQTVFDDKPDIKKLKKEEMSALLEKIFAETQTDILRYDKPLRSPAHPTMKPITLCAKLIFNSSRESETIYEPFGGSGSTLMAAEQLNRNCNSIELDERYCDVIVKRFLTSYPNQSVRLIRDGDEMDAKSLFSFK